jgi:hypothetical protein
MLGWLTGHGTTLVVAAVSFLAGITVVLPLGWTLPESAAALLGAVIGAVATIGGALILWQAQERQRTQHLAKSVAMQFGDVLHGSDELLSQLKVADAHVADENLHHQIQEQMNRLERMSNDLLRDVGKTKAKLDRFSQSLHLLASGQVAELMLAEAIVDTIQPIGERVANWFFPGAIPAAMYIPDALNDAHRDLMTSYDDLGKTLERLAPGWSNE